MSPMTVTLLARGSPDPRHARDVARLAGRLRESGIAAGAAYLDHTGPSPREAARSLRSAGAGTTTVVPLLVGPAHHARVEVPAAVRAMRAVAPGLAVSAAEPVGLDPQILAAAAELATGSGLPMDRGTGIILAGAGSRDSRTVTAVESLVRMRGQALVDALGARAVRAACLDGGRPLGSIRTLLRSVDGCTSFLVVALTITDGVLRDRIVAAAAHYDLPVAPGSLADTSAVADLVVLRAGSAPPPARAGAMEPLSPAR